MLCDVDDTLATAIETVVEGEWGGEGVREVVWAALERVVRGVEEGGGEVGGLVEGVGKWLDGE